MNPLTAKMLSDRAAKEADRAQQFADAAREGRLPTRYAGTVDGRPQLEQLGQGIREAKGLLSNAAMPVGGAIANKGGWLDTRPRVVTDQARSSKQTSIGGLILVATDWSLAALAGTAPVTGNDRTYARGSILSSILAKLKSRKKISLLTPATPSAVDSFIPDIPYLSTIGIDAEHYSINTPPATSSDPVPTGSLIMIGEEYTLDWLDYLKWHMKNGSSVIIMPQGVNLNPTFFASIATYLGIGGVGYLPESTVVNPGSIVYTRPHFTGVKTSEMLMVGITLVQNVLSGRMTAAPFDQFDFGSYGLETLVLSDQRYPMIAIVRASQMALD